MQLKTNALVLTPRNVGENDKILVMLSEELGVIEATARGAQRMKNKYSTLCQPFCYARVELFRGKSSWLIDNVEVLDAHFMLSADPFGAALASYFCEVVRTLSPSEDTAKDYLQLLMNLFYLLEQGTRDIKLLKAIFELRSLVYAGYAPNLVACKGCGKFEDEIMHFLPQQASLICSDCLQKEEGSLWQMPVSKAVLNAMRYIVYGDAHKIFSFRLKEPSLTALERVTQSYLLHCTESDYRSLQVYRSLIEPMFGKDI